MPTRGEGQREVDTPSTMLVHDTRLEGTAPPGADNIFIVNERTPLVHAFGWISQYAGSSGGLSRLVVMCHGLESGLYDADLCDSDMGFGLAFCAENLTLSNVARAAVLRGRVQQMVIYACGPARTRSGFQNTAADGQRFCSELAAHSGAVVYAATDTQWYHRVPSPSLIRRMLSIGPQNYIDFGVWEGRVLRFTPDGRISTAASGV